MKKPQTGEGTAPILYCHCAFAKIIAPPVKEAVLKELVESGVPFEAVPDLCEMSARKDPSLKRLQESGPLKIAACYPRAVEWLFHAAGTPLDPEQTEVLNMREEKAEEIVHRLLERGSDGNREAKGE